MEALSNEKLKKMNLASANKLAGRIRKILVDNVTVTGGHLASNLGIVEIAVALLRCFDPPRDKIIYDTGHQCYVHKLLTGRASRFSTLRQEGGISGFPRREESPFDAFGTGHSSTGISAALGFCEAQRLCGENDAWSVAVIGDGAFTNGMVFEALNNVREDDRLIIILNDNGMSISKNVGSLAEQLNKLRTGSGYYAMMEKSREAISAIPLVGKPVAGAIVGVKKRLKRAVVTQSNIFEQYGIRYFGPADGNDLATVERLIRVAKKQNAPCIIHLNTKKGKGYAPAESSPSHYHSVGAKKNSPEKHGSFSHVFGAELIRLAEEDERIVALTAAMCDGVGLEDFARRFPDRFFDVGIAEEHAMTCAAAMAAGGLSPFLALYSTFFQRAYDQFLHDAALQGLPVAVILDRAGLVGEDGPTHHGLFDVSMALNVPGVSISSPAAYRELVTELKALCARGEDGAPALKNPHIIRIPKGAQDPVICGAFPCREPVELTGDREPDCLFVAYGRICASALGAAAILRENGKRAAVMKITRLKPLDVRRIEALIKQNGAPGLVCAVEEGMRRGGFGEALVSDAATGGLSLGTADLMVCAVEDEFVPHGKTSAMLARCGLDAKSLAERALARLK